MRRHINVPVFIPHMGCPNQCVFCNQRTISGMAKFKLDDVNKIIEEVLSDAGSDAECEIAFFGGSFTGIDKELMIKLLEIGQSYIKSGAVSAMRCSTRPDYINGEILDILEKYGMSTIELGLQSISESVLQKTKRGHSSTASALACKLIVERGFTLGGQMMIGLPSASLADEIKTAEFIVNSGASEARIYPTIVFKDTELCSMTKGGEYVPLSQEDAVDRSAAALKILTDGGVKILRIGLCDSENLHSENTYFAGPNHAAIGELVQSRLYYNIIREKLNGISIKDKSHLTIFAPRGATSKVIGQNKENKIRLLNEYGFSSVKVLENEELQDYTALVMIKDKVR